MKHSKKIFLILFLFISSSVLATDLKFGIVIRPGITEEINQPFQLDFSVENANILTAYSFEWYVQYTIRDPNNQVVFQGTVPGVTIDPFTSVSLMSSASFTPTQTGSHTIQMVIQFGSDINYSNNTYQSTFGVLLPPPSAPMSSFPLDGATGIPPNANPLLGWDNGPNTPGNVTQIDVFLGTTPESADPNTGFPISSTTVFTNTLPSTFTPPEPLQPNQEYWWTIQAVNETGNTPGETRMFTTGSTPCSDENPLLVSPQDEAVDVFLNPTDLEVFIQNPGDFDRLDVFLGTTPEAATPGVGTPFTNTTVISNVQNYSVPIPPDFLEPNTEYWWGVNGVCELGENFSGLQTFITGETWCPRPPDINMPAQGTTDYPFGTETVPIEIVELNLQSVDPITVNFYGGPTPESVDPSFNSPVTMTNVLPIPTQVDLPIPNPLGPDQDFYIRTEVLCGGQSFPGDIREFHTEQGATVSGTVQKAYSETGQTFQVDSFFDIFYEIEVPFPNGTTKPVSQTTTSGEGGTFISDPLPSGIFESRIDVPETWGFVNPPGGVQSGEIQNGVNIEEFPWILIPPPEDVPGWKWEDDGDGEEEEGEPRIPDWPVDLTGTSFAGESISLSTTTDAEGNYQFNSVPPGSYIVSEGTVEGWQPAYPPGGVHEFIIDEGIPVGPFEFGNIPPPSIHGRKWFDWDKDGELDEDEVGLNGFVIELYNANDELLDVQETNNMDINEDGEINPLTEAGWFWFDNLTPGTYKIREVVPDGWEQTGPLPDLFWEVELLPGQIIDNIFFGNWWPLGIDFGDLPEPYVGSKPCPGGQCFPTIFPVGAGHLDQGPVLGNLRDTEGNGIPDLFAAGDDTTGQDDEDGVQFIKFLPSASGEVQVTVSGAPGDFPCWLSAWIDFDDDGALTLAENIIFAAIPAAGTHTFTFNVPNFVGGPGYARFRLSTNAWDVISPTGIAIDGEVEDYVGIGYDYGDANNDINQNTPFPTGYPVKLVQDGARHIATPLTRLGDVITDFEMDGQPTQPSTGDDNNNRPDEDGIEYVDGATVAYNGPDPDNPNRNITIYGYTLQSQISFKPHATKNGLLNMWVDWNRDGDWDDPDEQVFDDEPIKSGPDFSTLTFTVPANASLGWSYVRFRYSTIPALEVRGAAINGEVEDYLIAIHPPLDFGDLPEPYATLAIDNGPKHYIGGHYLGEQVDPEQDGQPQSEALGDDDDGNDDEDGVTFLGSLVRGEDVDVEVVVNTPTAQTGFLNGWIDYNSDGTFDTANETIINDEAVNSGTYTYTISIPDTAIAGNTFARFRFSELSGLGPDDNVVLTTLLNSFGEVEDYQVTIDSLVSSLDGLDFGLIPDEFKLHQNYPNPFNPVTTIVYDVAEQAHVKLDVYNVLGQKVASLVNETKSPGRYRAEFGTENLPSGIYIYKVEMQKYVKTMKMILMK